MSFHVLACTGRIRCVTAGLSHLVPTFKAKRASCTCTRLHLCIFNLSILSILSIYLFLSISIYFHLFLSISIYFYLFLSISIYLYLFLSISIYLYLSISIYICLYLSISIYIYVYLCISIYIYLYLCISIYIYLYLSIFFRSIAILYLTSICVYLISRAETLMLRLRAPKFP